MYQAQLREQICHPATIHLGWVLCQAHRPVLRRLVGYGQIYTRTFVTEEEGHGPKFWSGGRVRRVRKQEEAGPRTEESVPKEEGEDG